MLLQMYVKCKNIAVLSTELNGQLYDIIRFQLQNFNMIYQYLFNISFSILTPCILDLFRSFFSCVDFFFFKINVFNRFF